MILTQKSQSHLLFISTIITSEMEDRGGRDKKKKALPKNVATVMTVVIMDVY